LRYQRSGCNSLQVNFYPVLVALHVFANMVWIGSIATVGLIMSTNLLGSPGERGRLALWPYRCLAMPAFLLSLILGIACLILDPTKSLLKIPSMHAKLTLAVGVIALHHWIGIAARRTATGRREAALPIIGVVLLLVFAALAAVLGVVKPF
jgi:putative membrane protein